MLSTLGALGAVGGAGTVGAAAAALAYGAFHRNSRLFGAALDRLPTRDRIVALTFDDGPNPEATPLVLEALARNEVAATFFMLGRHVDRWPELAKEVVAAGHQPANHGYHHRKLHLRGPAYVRLDLGLGTDAIERASGVRPSHFRAPHGFRNPWVTPIASELGQRTIGWTLGVWDSNRPGAETIANRAIAGASPGCILLLHDGDGCDPRGDRTQTAAALPHIIGTLRDRGYRFVALPQ